LKFTILGGTGFIGSSITNYLKSQAIECDTLDLRTDKINEKSLGHVLYAIGVGDFIKRPFDAVTAHVCELQKILTKCKFDSFLYFSATRMYYKSNTTKETDPIITNPLDTNDLYAISKVMGESLCMSINNKNIRSIRLSNVSGDNFNSSFFLPSIIRDAVTKNKISIHTTLNSKKDYIHINDVLKIIPEISLRGKYRIYNVASGMNTKNSEIIDKLKELINFQLEISPNSKEYFFPNISIDRIIDEFGFKPTPILDTLEDMVSSFKNYFSH